jgi:hypothetical protein
MAGRPVQTFSTFLHGPITHDDVVPFFLFFLFSREASFPCILDFVSSSVKKKKILYLLLHVPEHDDVLELHSLFMFNLN